MRKVLTVLVVSLLFLVSVGSAQKVANVTSPVDIPSFAGYVQDEFVIVFKGNVGKIKSQVSTRGVTITGVSDFDAISQRYAVSKIKKQFMGTSEDYFSPTKELSKYYKVKFEDGTLEEAMDAYRQHPMVERVEPIGIHTVYATPNDGFYSSQWHLNQSSDKDIDAPEAWDVETGSGNVIVAILDTGVRYFHKDLGGANASYSNPQGTDGNMWINWAEKNGSAGVDDDGNGYVDDWVGWDFVNGATQCWSGEDCNGQDNDPRDFNGHGTHCAGNVGAINNNGYASCAPSGGWGNGSLQATANGVKVMACRIGWSGNWFGQEVGYIRMDFAAEAFYYAADNGARIASCSWGSSNSGGLGPAIDYFLASGGMIFKAAGNDGSQSADYMSSRTDIIDVAATDQSDCKASFSTYGSWVDISAPGVSILSSYHVHSNPSSDYVANLDGTSMATPLAASVAALIWSRNQGWSASQVEQQLYSSADDIYSLGCNSSYSGKLGAGRINAFNAVNTGTPPPVANFSGSPTSGCAPLTVNFTDQSTGDITSWSWDFGDGGSSTAQNPSHTYASVGQYTVSLTVTGAGGSDTYTRNNYITVNGGPTADFSGSPTSGIEPLTVNFSDLSSGATSWSWDFGDGGASTAQNPSHTYNAAGTYTVILTATNSCGSDVNTKVNYITVDPCTTPVANFVGSPTSGDAPLTVSFTDQSSGATSWSWDFGDGGSSTQQNPGYTYNNAGTYSVTLTVTNSCGSNQLVRTNYIIVNTPPCYAPVADFAGSPTSGNAPLAVNFTDQSTNNPTSWSWDFGDGGSSTQQNPNYTYNSAGVYTVSLSVTNSCGSDQIVKVDYITVNTGPVTGEGFILSRNADFSTDDRVFNRNETIYMKVWTDQVDYTNIKKAEWELRDPNKNKVRQSLTNHNDNTYTASFALSGLPSSSTTWTWKGKVEDNNRNRYQPTTNITVNDGPPPAPVANFTGSPTSGFAPLTVNFTDLSTNSPTSWSWDFGDGGTSTQQNPSYTYNNPGTYTVSLTATNAGGSDTNVKTNYITVNVCSAPIADFSGTPTSGDAPLTVSFTDQSTNSPSSWSWDFGDGGSSTQQNPNHTYNTAGTYTVSLTATNACGSNQVVKTGYITVTQPPCNAPTADFVGSPTSGNVPLTVSYTDQSTNSPTSWSWDFGDGGSSTQQNPSHTYNNAGTYTVSLSISNACGSDQLVRTNYITVNSGPITGEGFILSLNADFSTDDRLFSRSDTIYMKVWTDQVDYNNLKKNRWELKDVNKNKVRQSFTNNFDNTYTAAYYLGNLPSQATDWTWKGDIQDTNRNQYKPTTTITVTGGALSLNGTAMPVTYELIQNYPNPFNPSTSISFRLPEATHITLDVFNIKGQRVVTLAEGIYGAGDHSFDWDASGQSSGVYLYRLMTSNMVITKKMILLK